MAHKIAVIQAPSVLLDREATLTAMAGRVAEAAKAGAEAAIFPEAFIPGYPTWVWRLRPGGDLALSGKLHARLRKNAVDIEGGGLSPVEEMAREAGITLISGLHEIDSRFSASTLFNTVVVIGPDGRLLNRHRKLLPTNPERMVWGRGDGRGLRVVETPIGRVGTLICWENYMPLARYALYAQGMDILVAPTWECGETWHASMRHIAREGGCWTVSLATALQARDIPADLPGRDQLFPDAEEWVCDGDAIVFRPFGIPASGPHHRRTDILWAEIDPDAAPRARRSLDVTGHYARPDVFRLEVDRTPKDPVAFEG